MSSTQESPIAIGNRITFQKKKVGVSIIITQEVSPLNLALMILWWLGISACGVVFAYYWQSTSAQSDAIFFGVATAFVLYFMVRIGKTILWRLIGKEMLLINEDGLSLKNAYGNYGKAKSFIPENVKKLYLIPYNVGKFMEFMDRSSYVIGGDTIGFTYQGKEHRFAKQLEEKDAKVLFRLIDKSLREVVKARG